MSETFCMHLQKRSEILRLIRMTHLKYMWTKEGEDSKGATEGAEVVGVNEKTNATDGTTDRAIMHLGESPSIEEGGEEQGEKE